MTKRVTLPAAVPELRRAVNVLVLAKSAPTSTLAAALARGALRSNRQVSLLGGGPARQVQQTYRSGGIRPAVQAAKGLGVAVVLQTVTTDTYEADVSDLRLRKCLAQDRKRKCVRWSGSYKRLVENCSTTITYTVVDSSTTRVLDRVKSSARTTRSKGNYGPKPAGDRNTLCAKAVELASVALRPYLTPTTTELRLRYLRVDDGLGTTKEVIEDLRRGKTVKAAELLPEIPENVTDPQQRGLAWYNYAVFLWSNKDFGRCREVLQKAQATIGDTSEVRYLRQRCEMYHRPRA